MPELLVFEQRVGLHYTRSRKCFIDSVATYAVPNGDFASNPSPIAKVGLTLWETEGTSAQAVQDTRSSAQKSGLIQKNAATDQGTAEMVYWEPITPHITKNDFMR
jgi:hypothetical protein